MMSRAVRILILLAVRHGSVAQRLGVLYETAQTGARIIDDACNTVGGECQGLLVDAVADLDATVRQSADLGEYDQTSFEVQVLQNYRNTIEHACAIAMMSLVGSEEHIYSMGDVRDLYRCHFSYRSGAVAGVLVTNAVDAVLDMMETAGAVVGDVVVYDNIVVDNVAVTPFDADAVAGYFVMLSETTSNGFPHFTDDPVNCYKVLIYMVLHRAQVVSVVDVHTNIVFTLNRNHVDDNLLSNMEKMLLGR